VHAGDRDLQRAAERLAARLPAALAGLARLAYNYHWSWQPGGADVFRRVDPERWIRVAGNPVRLLQEASAGSIEAAAGDGELVERVSQLLASLDADLAQPYAPAAPASHERPTAFLCAEYAVHVSLPVYSGGLGALAGDLLKQASDDALPMVAVGLLYRQGYFRQRVDAVGRQHEYWVDSDPERLPAALVTGDDGAPLTITVPIWQEQVRAQIWRVDVGRVPLFLLDSDRAENSPLARWIVARLYISDPELRLAQYVLLGVGGVRALAAMGIDPARLHLNEGHPAFAALELARGESGNGGATAEALERVRARVAFTTHTPVPAGNDTYPVGQVGSVAGAFVNEIGLGLAGLARLGRADDTLAGQPFGLTEFALHTSASANAVSARHGEVARAMWHELWPDRSEDAVPIGHVTNGVHEPTWLGEPMRTLLDRHLPSGWLRRSADASEWQAVERIDARELWAARREQRAALVDAVRARSVFERLGRGDAASYARAAAESFDADTLTIGFARRIATYKRLGLLVADVDATRALLRGAHRIQIVLAGKAHPADEDGKRLLQRLFELKPSPEIAGRVVYLEDYDLATAALLVQGADVWLNLPRPPLEASGTSGMKAAVNGALHLSVLDGWWAEAYDGTNGWALSGEVLANEREQDRRDGAELRRLLIEEVVPLFYQRDRHGIPQRWLERVRSSLRSNGPTFSAQRMLRDYVALAASARPDGQARRRRARDR
jgi:starch phosphorylase